VSDAPAPPRLHRGGLALAARIVSWPASLLVLALGAVWRSTAFLLYPIGYAIASRPARPVATAAERLATFLRGAARYLGFATDTFPSIDGTSRGEGESPGPWHEARRRLCRSRVGLLSWIGTCLYLYVAFAAQMGWIAADFRVGAKDAEFLAPQWFSGPFALGTDQLGRSVLALALRGTTTAMWIGTVAALLSCAIGTVLGALAGYFGKWVDTVVVWLFTTVESIPYLLLLLAFAYVLKKNPGFVTWYEGRFLAQELHVSLGLFTMVLALGATSWVGVCRTVRGEFLRQRDRDYVVAARALGVPVGRIVFRHVLPNVFHLVVVSFSLLFVSSVKFEVILSFLGLGMEAGEASWGAMISQARLELLREPMVWWQLTTATVFMFGLVLCVNLFADALRDALDPRMKA
jgi:ABC-type dipeptide/oligopeptide/nickel transport system permease subunit